MHAASGPTYRERLAARRALLERAVARIVDICSALGDVRAGAAAFHAQQAAEKALKAACVIAIDDSPRTHVITHLLDELSNNEEIVGKEIFDAAAVLDR